MHKFPKAKWRKLDPSNVYSRTSGSKEKALETGCQTDSNATASPWRRLNHNDDDK